MTKVLRSTHRVHVLYASENKQRLFPYTTLLDWFCSRDGVCLLRFTYWVFQSVVELLVLKALNFARLDPLLLLFNFQKS